MKVEDFTPAELLVLGWMSYGLRNDEICKLLWLAKGTVKTHLYRSFQKGGFRNRIDAARWYICYVEGRVRMPARATMREEVA